MQSISVAEICDRLEKTLVRDFVLSSSFKNIKDGILDAKRKRQIVIIQALTAIFIIRSTVQTYFQTDEVQFWTLGSLYAYNRLGRFMSGVTAIAWTGVLAHAIVISHYERISNLGIITDLRTMYRKLTKPTAKETLDFCYFLWWLTHQRTLSIITTTLSMLTFREVGAIILARRFKSVWFLVFYTPDLFYFGFCQTYMASVMFCVHFLIGQSTTYFRLRLTRFRKSMEVINLSLIGNKLENLVHIRVTLFKLQDILDEVQQHNRVIRYLLRDQLLSMGGMYSLCLAFAVEDSAWYFRLLPVMTIGLVAISVAMSLDGASNLHVLIRSTARTLHSCQVSFISSEKNETCLKSKSKHAPFHSSIDRIKVKYDVLRMIHRVSSGYLRIGFTVGDGESFSPLSFASFVISIICTSLMFMNSTGSAFTIL